MKKLLDNAWVLTMDGRRAPFRGTVGIEGDTISFVVQDGQDASTVSCFREDPATEIIDCAGKLVMPGLVNIHGHVSMTLMRSYADDLPLMTWLHDHIWPIESKLTGEDISVGAELGIAEMLLGGTTTFADMYWQEREVARAVEKAGIRAVLSPTFTDNKFQDFLEDFDVLINEYHGREGLVTLMVAPHAVYSCSREHLLAAKDIAQKYGLGIQIHVSETLDEQATSAREFGSSPIEYLDSLGMLNRKTLAVHCVHVSEKDIAIMAERGVSVAYNPQSNMKISSGVAPVTRMMESGINVGVGTDGPSSNNDLDMWEEMRTGAFLQKVSTGDPTVLPAYDVLEMATVNGARALGIQDRTGMLRPGMQADIIALDIEKPHYYPRHDIVANLAYCGKSSDVDSVIIAGKLVVENRRVVNLDLTSIYEKVEKRVNNLIS